MIGRHPFVKIIFLALLSAACTLAHASSAALQAKLEQVAQTSGGKVGIGLMLMETQESAWLNPHSQFPMQSVYKFPIAMAVLAAIDAGKLKLDDMVTVNKSDLVGKRQHSPVRDLHPEGDFPMSVNELLRYAVSESDGTASDVLLRTMGGPSRVMAFLKQLGVNQIHVLNTESELGENNSTQYRNSASPQAAINLLQVFYAGKGLSPDSRSLIMKLMLETETGPQRIKGLLPAGTPVAHKTGTSLSAQGNTAATNDIGIVTLPDGKHLAIAVFVSDSPASTAIREQVIAQAARLAWDNWTKN
ncbi:class A beta-lactamase [Undibacterium sp.]|jgi:beta-lactamase class A|uniref:class A beta-lactamase n=1 Tax=Undibacterium sp. TaxID=1914977 RepID=UPI002B55B394|nr:class A beta-lactamase [Undibacterium sp.]HTD03185.1 class A beta-lactamase [Undibacterium sp.]